MDEIQNILQMMEHSIALIGVYDQDEKLQFTNSAFRKAYFIEPNEELHWQQLMRRNFHAKRGTIITTEDIEAWIASVRSRRGKKRVRTYESDLHDGSFIWVTETMLANGWIIYVGTDVTDLKPSERLVRMARDDALRASTTDALTGVSNRRHILGQLDSMLLDPSEPSNRLNDIPVEKGGSACIVDIDFFKRINDTYGHVSGDAVLVAFAHSCRETIKLRDAFGRVGGEEFLILFPGQGSDEASRTVQALFKAIHLLRPINEDQKHEVTFSAGMTELLPDDTTTKVLIRCDKALYLAKEAGRNRLIVEANPS